MKIIIFFDALNFQHIKTLYILLHMLKFKICRTKPLMCLFFSSRTLFYVLSACVLIFFKKINLFCVLHRNELTCVC